MRFLTRKWADGVYSDQQAGIIYGAYLEHLEELLPDMPLGFRNWVRLGAGSGVRGAPLLSARYDAPTGTFTLKLRPDLPPVLEARLCYLGAVNGSFDLEELERLIAGGESRCLFDEPDFGGDEDIWMHSILLEPEGEFSIRFREFRFEVTLDPDWDEEE